MHRRGGSRACKKSETKTKVLGKGDHTSQQPATQDRNGEVVLTQTYNGNKMQTGARVGEMSGETRVMVVGGGRDSGAVVETLRDRAYEYY